MQWQLQVWVKTWPTRQNRWEWTTVSRVVLPNVASPLLRWHIKWYQDVGRCTRDGALVHKICNSWDHQLYHPHHPCPNGGTANRYQPAHWARLPGHQDRPARILTSPHHSKRNRPVTNKVLLGSCLTYFHTGLTRRKNYFPTKNSNDSRNHHHPATCTSSPNLQSWEKWTFGHPHPCELDSCFTLNYSNALQKRDLFFCTCLH